MKRPDNAAFIWSTDTTIYLELIGTTGKPHQVTYPSDVEGLKAMLVYLRSRGEHSKIATLGAPTQHNIDQLVKEFKGPINRTRRKLNPRIAEKAKELLRKLEMIP